MTGGSVTLASSDPFTEPIFNPNYLSEAIDRHAMIENIKLVRRFVAAPAWSGMILGPLGNHTDYVTPEQLDEFVTQNSELSIPVVRIV